MPADIIICKLLKLKNQSNASLKRYVLTRDMNCWTVSAYFIESGRLFRSLGAPIENALSPYVVVNDLGTINSLLLLEIGSKGLDLKGQFVLDVIIQRFYSFLIGCLSFP